MADCAAAFCVRVQDDDWQNWSAAFTVAKALDTLVDDDHEYDTDGYAEAVLAGQPVPYMTHEESGFVADRYAHLSAESQERWHQAAYKLGEFALLRADARTVDEYIQVTQDESELMAGVLQVECATSDEDVSAREQFNEWVYVMGCTAYACDTLSDCIKDYNDGNMYIQPNLGVMLRLGGAAAREVVEFAKVTPLDIYKAIAVRSCTKIREKVMQPGYWRRQFVMTKSIAPGTSHSDMIK